MMPVHQGFHPLSGTALNSLYNFAQRFFYHDDGMAFVSYRIGLAPSWEGTRAWLDFFF